MKYLGQFFLFVLFGLLNYGCKSSAGQQLADSARVNRFDSSFIRLEKQECYGTCPVYIITIYGTGKVEYEGKKHVKRVGKFKKELFFQEINQLFNAYECANFFDFNREYDEPDLQDLPTTYVTFKHRGFEKRIKDYYNAPEELKHLEKMVEKIAESEEGWIQRSDE